MTGRFAAKLPAKNVDVAVAVDVADVERRVPRIAYFNRVFDEGRHPGPLEPDHRRQCRLVDVGSTGEQRARDDIEIAIAIQIHGHRPVDARQIREPVIDERIGPRVLQPLNAVIRLHDAVVERISVRQEHVEIPIVVHVDELNA